jgi:hypothetical protein
MIALRDVLQTLRAMLAGMPAASNAGSSGDGVISAGALELIELMHGRQPSAAPRAAA